MTGVSSTTNSKLLYNSKYTRSSLQKDDMFFLKMKVYVQSKALTDSFLSEITAVFMLTIQKSWKQ